MWVILHSVIRVQAFELRVFCLKPTRQTPQTSPSVSWDNFIHWSAVIWIRYDFSLCIHHHKKNQSLFWQRFWQRYSANSEYLLYTLLFIHRIILKVVLFYISCNCWHFIWGDFFICLYLFSAHRILMNFGRRKDGNFHFGEKSQDELLSFKCLHWWSFRDGSHISVRNRINLKFGQNSLINVTFGIEVA